MLVTTDTKFLLTCYRLWKTRDRFPQARQVISQWVSETKFVGPIQDMSNSTWIVKV